MAESYTDEEVIEKLSEMKRHGHGKLTQVVRDHEVVGFEEYKTHQKRDKRQLPLD